MKPKNNEPHCDGGICYDSPIKEAVKDAKSQNKMAFVLFFTESCGWCHRFINETLTDPAVQTKLDKEYIVVKLEVNQKKL